MCDIYMCVQHNKMYDISEIGPTLSRAKLNRSKTECRSINLHVILSDKKYIALTASSPKKHEALTQCWAGVADDAPILSQDWESINVTLYNLQSPWYFSSNMPEGDRKKINVMYCDGI